MAEEIPTIEVPSYQTEPAEYEEVQLTQGTWNIFPILPIYRLILRFSEGADGRITQTERGLIVVIESAQASVFLQADCKKDTTCSVGYTKNAFFKLGALLGSGSGGGSYTFNAPLDNASGQISLNLASDLQIKNGNLTLKLTSNDDFIRLAQIAQSAVGGIVWMGKVPNTNAEVTANPTLLTNYIQTITGEAPKVGNLLLTADTPPYGWIYTNTYDPSSGQITGQVWDTIGTTAVSIATQNTVGLVKGSNTIQIEVDGSANLDFSALFYQQGESIPEGQWRLSPITPNP